MYMYKLKINWCMCIIEIKKIPTFLWIKVVINASKHKVYMKGKCGKLKREYIGAVLSDLAICNQSGEF